MGNEESQSERLARLRRQAVARLQKEEESLAEMSPEEVARTVQELHMYQIELEMQNEELRYAQVELAESRDRFTDLYDSAPVGYLTLSEKGLILEANLTFAELLGVVRGLLVGQPFSAFILDFDQEVYYFHRRQILETRQRHWCELRLRRGDGKCFWAKLECSIVEGKGGLVQIRMAISDVSERKQSEENLKRAMLAAEAANEAKSRFLANMSHEIRTPMTAIMGYIDLMRLFDVPHDKYRQYLDTVHENADHLLTLINDILDLSQIDTGKLKLESKPCSAIKTVEYVVRLLQSWADKKHLSLDIDYEFPLPETIRTDPERLRQILVNLVGNAIKFTDAGGVKITLACVVREDEGLRMQFKVADTGIGISDKDRSQLFHPFTQVDESMDRQSSGTGLGLSISQELAHLLGGRIELESRLGKGSVFTLTIDAGPREDLAVLDSLAANIAAEEPSREPGLPLELHGSVLVAEDDDGLQYLLSYYLESSGLSVDTASDGEATYEMAMQSMEQGNPYDLILMDIRMPKMDGYEVTRRLRENGWQGPIVAQTAHALTGDRDKCLAVGCDDYITKPSSPKALFDLIGSFLPQPVGVAETSASAWKGNSFVSEG